LLDSVVLRMQIQILTSKINCIIKNISITCNLSFIRYKSSVISDYARMEYKTYVNEHSNPSSPKHVSCPETDHTLKNELSDHNSMID